MTDDSAREAFLAGDRTDDVAFFLAEDVVDGLGDLEEYGERVDEGVVLVIDGERGRNAFSAATGTDAMAFAKRAMGTEGLIDAGLTGGTCPADSPDDEHVPRFVFAFAEAQNEDVGGIYAEGDVIHAYAQCSCGTTYADKWVVGERA